MKRHLFLAIALLAMRAIGQPHSYPPSGETGVHGWQNGSFLIGWRAISGAVAYEYVLTNNALCFVGCAGDTRNQTVVDTFAVEYELIPDTWYYWITRIYFADGDTSGWTAISSFQTPRKEEEPPMKLYPNPIQGPQFTWRLDWSAEPKAIRAEGALTSVSGEALMLNVRLVAERSWFRFQDIPINAASLASGSYIFRVAFYDLSGQVLRIRVEKLLRL